MGFMYLTQEQINLLFTTIDRTCGVDSPFIFTTMIKRKSDKRIRFYPQSLLLDWWMDGRGEPFLWALPAQGVNDFAKSKNRRLGSIHDHQSLALEESIDVPLAQGEIVVFLT